MPARKASTQKPQEKRSTSKESTPERKSNILRRIFNGFAVRKNPQKLTQIPQKVYPSQVYSNDLANRRRFVLENPPQSPRKTVGHTSNYFSTNPMPYDDDQNSSISSLLTAADEESPVSSPVVLRKKQHPNSASSRLQQPVLFTKKSPIANRHIMRPRAQKAPAAASYLNNFQQQSPAASVRRKPPPLNIRTPLPRTLSMDRNNIKTRSNEVNGVMLMNNRSSLAEKPVHKVNLEKQLSQLLSPTTITTNGDIPRPKKTSTPKNVTLSSQSFSNRSVISPILSPPPPEKMAATQIDAATYMKLLDMKRRSDAELLRRSESCQPKMVNGNAAKSPSSGRNYDWVRNSPQRTSVTGAAPSRAPFR